jgi:hypothetical protein
MEHLAVGLGVIGAIILLQTLSGVSFSLGSKQLTEICPVTEIITLPSIAPGTISRVDCVHLIAGSFWTYLARNSLK